METEFKIQQNSESFTSIKASPIKCNTIKKDRELGLNQQNGSNLKRLEKNAVSLRKNKRTNLIRHKRNTLNINNTNLNSNVNNVNNPEINNSYNNQQIDQNIINQSKNLNDQDKQVSDNTQLPPINTFDSKEPNEHTTNIQQVITELEAQHYFKLVNEKPLNFGSLVGSNVNTEPQDEIYSNKQIYEKMFKLNLALGAQSFKNISIIELPTILQMIANNNALIRFAGLYLLSKIIKQCNGKIQGELFFNKEFMTLLVVQMTQENNLMLKNQYVECATQVLKVGRGDIFKVIVNDAHYPQASLMCLDQVSKSFHNEYSGDLRLENVFIEMVQTIIWSIGLLIGDETEYQKIFLDLNVVPSILNVISTLGEEVYEKYYSNLSQIASYLFNNITWTYDEIGFEGTFDHFDQLKMIIPFLLESIVRQATHDDYGIGPSGMIEEEDVFYDGPDHLEVYSTLEVLLHMGGSDAAEILNNFSQIDISVKQMFTTFERTAQLITVLDCQQEAPYDFHYPVLIQVTQTVLAMADGIDLRLPHKLLQAGVLEKWTEALVVLVNAKKNIYLDDALYHILGLFSEFAGNDFFHERIIDTPCLIETIFRSLIIDPKRVWNHRMAPELTAFCMNMCNTENIIYIKRLCEMGLVQAICHQLCTYYDKSNVVTHYSLDSLETLLLGIPDEEVGMQVQAQVDFYKDDTSGLQVVEVLELLADSEKQELSAKAMELLEYLYMGIEDEELIFSFDDLKEIKATDATNTLSSEQIITNNIGNNIQVEITPQSEEKPIVFNI